MLRINQFITAVAKKWGSLVTGGVLIGILATWQGTGHSVSPWIYGGIAAGGAIVAIFKAWGGTGGARGAGRGPRRGIARRARLCAFR